MNNFEHDKYIEGQKGEYIITLESNFNWAGMVLLEQVVWVDDCGQIKKGKISSFFISNDQNSSWPSTKFTVVLNNGAIMTQLEYNRLYFTKPVVVFVKKKTNKIISLLENIIKELKDVS